jgi:uncharacterized protein (TIGR03086 family)
MTRAGPGHTGDPGEAGLGALGAAERHRRVAGGFGLVVASTADWQAPTPVEGWVARDVVAHLVGWFPPFLAAAGVELPAAPPVGADPVAAWEAVAGGVQALLDDPGRAASTITHPRAGTHRLADAVDAFWTADVFMHTWDLARAGGTDPHLDPGWCTQLLEGMREMQQAMRASGQYGPPVAVPDDAEPQARLMAFIGRDPRWTPPGR